MSKTIDAVTHVMEMDRELEMLKIENVMLKKELDEKERVSSCVREGISPMDKLAIKYGKDKLFNQIFYYSNQYVVAKREKEEIIYTPFETWATSYAEYNDERIPLDVTINDVIKYFKDKLLKIYKEKCNEAYENLLKSEQEESEDEE